MPSYQDSESVCVLCTKVGHIGKNCPEKVCILCLASGHVFTECNAINDNVKGEPLEIKEEKVAPKNDLQIQSNENSNLIVKQENSDEPAINKEKPIMSKDSESKTGDAVTETASKYDDENSGIVDPSKTRESKSGYEVISESKFRENMIQLFEDRVPEKMIDTFKKHECGLCKESFSSEKYAWKHYFGQDHKQRVKTETKEKKYTYPSFWKIILFALEYNESLGMSKHEIYEFLVSRFKDLKANMTSEDIKEKIRTSLDYMCEFYQNARVKNGIYFMKQRGREELQKIKASREFEGQIDHSVTHSQSNARVDNIKDRDIYAERENHDGKRSRNYESERYVEKRQRYERSDVNKESRHSSSRRSNESERYKRSSDRYYKDDGQSYKSSSSSGTRHRRNSHSKSRHTRRSSSREKGSRKSVSKESNVQLPTPPPELFSHNLGPAAQNFQPILQNPPVLQQFPNFGHMQQMMSPMGPILIMAPENLPAGMLNMLPGMSQIPASFLNSGYSPSMFPASVSPPSTPPTGERSAGL